MSADGVFVYHDPLRPAPAGNLCGWDEGYEDMSNLYYANSLGSGICVETCPSETDER